MTPTPRPDDRQPWVVLSGTTLERTGAALAEHGFTVTLQEFCAEIVNLQRVEGRESLPKPRWQAIPTADGRPRLGSSCACCEQSPRARTGSSCQRAEMLHEVSTQVMCVGVGVGT